MATQLYAGGARRSAAPTVITQPVQRSAVGFDPSLLLQVLTQSAQSATPAVMQAAGQNDAAAASVGANPATAGGAFGPAQLGQLASVLGIGAQLTKDNELGRLASDVGTAAGLGNAFGRAQAGDLKGVALSVAPALGRELGVPGPVVGFGMNAVRGDIPGMINSAISANPALGLLNALGGLFGIGTIGTALAGNINETFDDRAISIDGLAGTQVSGINTGNYYSYTEALADGDSSLNSGTGVNTVTDPISGNTYSEAGNSGFSFDTNQDGSTSVTTDTGNTYTEAAPTDRTSDSDDSAGWGDPGSYSGY